MAHKQSRTSDFQDPKKYIPSLEIGEYEHYKKKQTKKGGLYPLGEEGEYGAAPSSLPPPLPGYQKRERKPKVYASYAVSSDCEAHGEKLSRQSVPCQPRPARRASSYSRGSPAPARQERSCSQPRQRSASFRQPSPSPPSPHQDGYYGRADWKGSLRSTESPARSYRAPSYPRKSSRSSQRDSVSPEHAVPPPREPVQDWAPRPERRSVSSTDSTDWGYTSYNNFTRGTASSSRYSRQVRDQSFDESYEEDRAEKYSYNNNNSYSSKTAGVGKVGLATLKTPEINPWDNMGILGLSSKMFSDTSSAKQGVFSSSSLLRRESVSSHVM